MLSVDAKLASYKLSTGEPFLFEVRFREKDSGDPLPIEERAYVLVFYDKDGHIVHSITPTRKPNSTLRFARDAAFGQGLYDAKLAVKVELAERLPIGKNVIAAGTLTISQSAEGIEPFATASPRYFVPRATITVDSATGAIETDTTGVMIIDDGSLFPGSEPLPRPTISISAGQALAVGDSGTTEFKFTVALNRDGSTSPKIFDWTVFGIGENPADPADFGGAFPSGTFTFDPDASSALISATVVGNLTEVTDEMFGLSAALRDGNTDTVYNTIIHRPASPPPPPPPVPVPTIAFGEAFYSVAEGDSEPKTLTIPVILNRDGLTGAQTIDFTYGGSATKGTDYAAPPVSLSIGSSVSTGNLILTINGDTEVEGNEAIIVGAGLNGYENATAETTVTIADNDVAPAPAFTSLPSISSDGSAAVGEFAEFDFGTANRPFGNKRLYRNGADFADASGGSIQWAQTGDYQLWVYLEDGVTLAKSAVLTVAAAPQTVVEPLTIAFASKNEDGSDYVAGTNPPLIVVGIGDNTDKDQFRGIIWYDRGGTGGLVKDDARKIVIEDLRAAFDAEEFVTNTINGLASGPFRALAGIQDKTTNAYGPDSATISQTLNDVALPPAVTVLDENEESHYVILDQADKRQATGLSSAGTYQARRLTGTRDIPTQGEIKVLALGNSDRTGNVGWFINSPAELPSQFKIPTAATSITSLATAVGDIFSFEAIPASDDGVNDGTFKVWKNGTLISTKNHAFKTYRVGALWFRNEKMRINTGQEELAYPAISAVRRYN